MNWFVACDFCSWLSGLHGVGFRLPTEAEWEKTARGTDNRVYPWGNESPTEKQANFKYNTGMSMSVRAHPGGASPYGVEDLAGNAFEWVWDFYQKNYYSIGSTDNINPLGPADGTSRVVKGGSWEGDSRQIRISYRDSADPTGKFADIGFRCAVNSLKGI